MGRENGRRLGVIGAGNIGGAIAANLLADGHAVAVHDTDRARVDALVRTGAAIMEAVAEAWLSEAPRDSVLVDLSTNAPATIRRVGERLAAAGRHLLEAPLTG